MPLEPLVADAKLPAPANGFTWTALSIMCCDDDEYRNLVSVSFQENDDVFLCDVLHLIIM
ncbi:hypothetical protein N7465_006008 [Penicillium sp. CMV-2018d]|nr:hypothetical protein N7465_006008 [Penicillium sp. CMV-2018d]